MKKLEAKAGYKYYDGNTIATEVCLPDNADESVWKTITDQEANEITKAKMEEMKNDFTNNAKEIGTIDDPDDTMADETNIQ